LPSGENKNNRKGHKAKAKFTKLKFKKKSLCPLRNTFVISAVNRFHFWKSTFVVKENELNKNFILSKPSERIIALRKKTLDSKRYISTEQAFIITNFYKKNDNLPVIIKRARAFSDVAASIKISIDPHELIVGNRTSSIRAGVVFPEAGINWLSKEICGIETRPQDPFLVSETEIDIFRTEIEPFWKNRSLEYAIDQSYGEELRSFEKVVKVNQKDHAQGHICPDVGKWLEYGPSGLISEAEAQLSKDSCSDNDFYEAVIISLRASSVFMMRYADLALKMALTEKELVVKNNLNEISAICSKLSCSPPESFREALQSVWFLFVLLQIESNASSFSPGRMDQYLYKYYKADLINGKHTDIEFLELIDSLFIKFNQIVYMRNSHSARYFAGFPIGFNVTLGGQINDGEDAVNELTHLFLMAQDHVRMPQPNLTARLHHGSDDSYLNECSRIIGIGTGMPQIVNDESIIPSLIKAGTEHSDALDYALVGCVELTTQGNYLGWSDAAMFNLVKVLELTLNNGKCMLSGIQMGPETGYLSDFTDYRSLEDAFRNQIDYFIKKMIPACEIVEKAHQQYLPSPFLSSVINNCIKTGRDVTAGGAKYNYSGIQLIQVANIADSLAVLRNLVFEKKTITGESFLKTLKNNFKGDEVLRQFCINKVDKYGNDFAAVDETGAYWAEYFAQKLGEYSNIRGGSYKMGFYTVSAHVPMGQNVAATPDGRLSKTPLADGGLSPMNGRDNSGPTAVFNSVAKIPSLLASNGTLLNMKFLPSFFSDKYDLLKFSSLLMSFISLPIHHVQFNVVTAEELIKAKEDPDSYKGLTIRVAGYTAYFTELSGDLQDEIIKRTTHG
jgi:pyruvate formate-lyase/glycerol dehydratase family glycyl radical enzyme